MILAAGEGRRLRPLTETLPKALVEVGGRPLIEYALDAVTRSGIDDVIVNLHHHGEQIRRHLGDGARFGARIRYSEETTLLGSGGGIVHARALLGDEPFVTLNADTIVDVDLRAVVRFHESKRAIATLVLRKDPRMSEYGIIQTLPGGLIGRFLKHARPNAAGAMEAFMYTGVQVLDPAIFRYMPGEGAFSITEATYPRMLAADEPVFGYPFEGTFITVGTPDELENARRALPARLDSRKPPGLS
jgi:NDP-sugar pyrophosphorylase family protein